MLTNTTAHKKKYKEKKAEFLKKKTVTAWRTKINL